MTYFIARRSFNNPHLPDPCDISTIVNEPLSVVLAEANHRSGVPRTFRVWHRRGDAWHELTDLEFRISGKDRFEAAQGALRFHVDKRSDGWHAFGWEGSRLDWNPQPFTHRESAMAWCTDSYGIHEIAADVPCN